MMIIDSKKIKNIKSGYEQEFFYDENGEFLYSKDSNGMIKNSYNSYLNDTLSLTTI